MVLFIPFKMLPNYPLWSTQALSKLYYFVYSYLIVSISYHDLKAYKTKANVPRAVNHTIVVSCPAPYNTTHMISSVIYVFVGSLCWGIFLINLTFHKIDIVHVFLLFFF